MGAARTPSRRTGETWRVTCASVGIADGLVRVRCSADVEEFLAALVTGASARPGGGDVDDVGDRGAHRPLAPASVARALAAVRAWHDFPLQEGVVTADPAAEVRAPHRPERLPKALTLAQVEVLLAAAAADETSDPLALRDRALLELLYATGARISEPAFAGRR